MNVAKNGKMKPGKDGEAKPRMISLVEQLQRHTNRMIVKKVKRFKKREGVQKHDKRAPMINMGNKDRGIPFRGRDRFAGGLKKLADRIWDTYVVESDDDYKYAPGTVIQRQAVYDNNKYNGNGTLKD